MCVCVEVFYQLSAWKIEVNKVQISDEVANVPLAQMPLGKA